MIGFKILYCLYVHGPTSSYPRFVQAKWLVQVSPVRQFWVNRATVFTQAVLLKLILDALVESEKVGLAFKRLPLVLVVLKDWLHGAGVKIGPQGREAHFRKAHCPRCAVCGLHVCCELEELGTQNYDKGATTSPTMFPQITHAILSKKSLEIRGCQ